MKSSKSFYASKTIIGAFIVLVATIFPQFITETEATQIVELFTHIIGIAFVIYGRITATKKIK